MPTYKNSVVPESPFRRENAPVLPTEATALPKGLDPTKALLTKLGEHLSKGEFKKFYETLQEDREHTRKIRAAMEEERKKWEPIDPDYLNRHEGQQSHARFMSEVTRRLTGGESSGQGGLSLTEIHQAAAPVRRWLGLEE